MSEKTAKKQRKEQQPEVIYEMRIKVLRFPNGKAGTHVSGIPQNFTHARNMLFDAFTVVTDTFMEALASDRASMGSNRIKVAQTIPNLH